MKARQKSARRTPPKGFTDEEKAAMRQRVTELQTNKAEGEDAVLEKIAEMTPADRALAERLHAIVKANAPRLSPRLWYGMPAYATGDKIVCHFQPAQKFKTRYATFAFTDKANLDEGALWPVAYAVKELKGAEEVRVTALLRKALT